MKEIELHVSSPCVCVEHREWIHVNLETLAEVVTPPFCGYHHLSATQLMGASLPVRPYCAVEQSCERTQRSLVGPYRVPTTADDNDRPMVPGTAKMRYVDREA